MLLPFAVYTAREGYGWTAGGSHDRSMLERLRRAVGKTPDFDYGAPGCCGAVNDGDTVAVYRFMRVEKWDSKGRNASYLALIFFPRSLADRINFVCLFQLEPFLSPLRQPPEWIDYSDGASDNDAFNPEVDCAAGATIEPACGGAVFAKDFTGKLRLIREDGSAGGRFRVFYERVIPACAVIAASPSASEERIARNAPVAVTVPELTPRRRALCWQVAAAVAVLALAAGGIYRLTEGGKVQATATASIQGHVALVVGREELLAGLFDKNGHWQGVAEFSKMPDESACGVPTTGENEAKSVQSFGTSVRRGRADAGKESGANHD